MVIGAQRDEHILDGGQQRDRPHDKGERAEHELLRDASDAAVAGNERLGYIHRAGADIAVHHAQRDEHRRDAHRNRSVRGCLLGLLFHKPVSFPTLMFEGIIGNRPCFNALFSQLDKDLYSL